MNLKVETLTLIKETFILACWVIFEVGTSIQNKFEHAYKFFVLLVYECIMYNIYVWEMIMHKKINILTTIKEVLSGKNFRPIIHNFEQIFFPLFKNYQSDFNEIQTFYH